MVPGFGLPVAVVAAALEMFITALVMGILGLAVIILVVAAFTRLSRRLGAVYQMAGLPPLFEGVLP